MKPTKRVVNKTVDKVVGKTNSGTVKIDHVDPQHLLHVSEALVHKVGRGLGTHMEAVNNTLGVCSLGALSFVVGANPQTLPAVYLLFMSTCMPYRIWSFHNQKGTFYLVDFCYFANAAAVVFLLFLKDNIKAQALVTALCDGPLAAASVVWQCSWVMGSLQHTTSVLMHILPGLALFCYHFYVQCPSNSWVQRLHQPFCDSVPSWTMKQQLVWLFGYPLLFYVIWQLLYFLIVQVWWRQHILKHGYGTSYTELAKRAAKTNNFWNRLVRKGSITRRVCVYGAIQLAFTVMTLFIFLFVYTRFWPTLAWQVVKVVTAVYYGSTYQCIKVPERAFLAGVKKLHISESPS